MPAGWEAIAANSEESKPQVRELVQSLSLTLGSARPSTDSSDLMDRSRSEGARPRWALLAAKDPSLPPLQQFCGPALPARCAAWRSTMTRDAGPGHRSVSSLAAGEKGRLNTLVSRAISAKPLLAAIAARTIPAMDLTADIVRQLRNFKDAALNAQVTKLWGSVRDSDADKLKDIARIKQLVTSRPAGDPGKGRAIFSRTCQQCHTLFDVGGKVGPTSPGPTAVT
jgi:hypothetical protein